MNRYLYCVTEIPPPPEPVVEESDADRREREAARLAVPPVQPGDDPPTYGDEGGGNQYPERSSECPPKNRIPFLRRILVSELWPWRLPGERA
jgi:hypothetical protein